MQLENLRSYVNDVFKQFCCGCGYVPTFDKKVVYTKLWTESDSQGASKYR